MIEVVPALFLEEGAAADDVLQVLLEQAVTLVHPALRTEAAQHPADVGLFDQYAGDVVPLAGDEGLGVARKRHAHGARKIAAGIQHAPGTSSGERSSMTLSQKTGVSWQAMPHSRFTETACGAPPWRCDRRSGA